MEAILLISAVILPFLVPLASDKVRYYFFLLIVFFNSTVTAIPAIQVFLYGYPVREFIMTGLLGFIEFTIDELSAFFILVTNLIVLAGSIYAGGYLKPYRQIKRPAQFALHYFSFIWLHLSMLGVLMLRDGIAFLIAWELMAVSSFMLILFEAEKRETLKTAVSYLIQMHIGLVLLLIAFLICEAETGKMSFDALGQYFSNHSNIGLFVLFFIGFAIKAGFVPFHIWLPGAHPAAPSHVSGVMSGVMIKMGIFGILRVLTFIQSDYYTIGLIILIISAVSGLFGVMMAIVQHDLKKLLAYHSIENIGIIGIGIGIGVIGLGTGNTALAVLGFSGGMLHVLNHSLFKSLLFFSTGNVYQAYHTRHIEALGGVVHKMPFTAMLFLIGSVAICGLPPLNGFISEILIYLGLFNGMVMGSPYQSIAMIMVVVALVMIGGLAIFCFTKAFGVVFLGSSRKHAPENISEAGKGMLASQVVLAGVMLFIGLFPSWFIHPLVQVINNQFHLTPQLAPVIPSDTLSMIPRLGLILLSGIFILWLIRGYFCRKMVPATGTTWGCGFTRATARQQYTGTSYADNFIDWAKPVVGVTKEHLPAGQEEIFPAPRKFEVHSVDMFSKMLTWLSGLIMLVLKKLARLQTGNIQHYILYAFIFMIIIFILLYLKVL